MRPDLSICVVSYNTRNLLQQCLDSAVAEVGGALQSELWVADNGSVDGSVALVRERYPAANLLENAENVGFARAMNQCLERSQGRYILLLNSDAVVQPGAIRRLYHFMETHPRAGVVGPALLNTDGSFQRSWFSFPTFWGELSGRQGRASRLRKLPVHGMAFKADWVNGACLLARRRAVESVGLLDQRFFMYSEETDWCRRMQDAGWDCYCLPSARVIHLGGGSTGSNNLGLLVQLYRSKLYYFHKHYGPFQARSLQAALLLRFALRAALEGSGYLLSVGRYERGKALLRQRLALLRETGRIDLSWS